jgi:hypothetical protein
MPRSCLSFSFVFSPPVAFLAVVLLFPASAWLLAGAVYCNVAVLQVLLVHVKLY